MDQSLRLLFQIAEGQHGLVTTGDVVSGGLTYDRLRHLVDTGVLIRVHHGVYKVATTPDTLEQRALGACLACGPGTVASHRMAGALWEILPEPSVHWPVEVTMTRGRRTKRPGIRARCTELGHRDRAKRDGVPLTRVERTLADLAGVLRVSELEEALDEALRRRLTTPERLLDYRRRMSSNRKGIGELARLAGQRTGLGVSESKLEDLAFRLLVRAGLPQPARQHRVEIDGRVHRLDLSYPDRRVAIELEGEAPHWGRERWQKDHDRHYRLERAGWRPLYFTWQDVTTRPLKVVLHVGEALGLWPRKWHPAPKIRLASRPS